MNINLEKDEVLIVGDGKSGKGASLLLNNNGFKTKIVNTKDKILNHKEYGFKKIVVSPGISIHDKFFRPFLKAGITLYSEVNLALEYTNKNVYGITGTNGKTTTTLLLAHIFNIAEQRTKAVGNCGEVFSEQVTSESETVNYSLELSSFMLMLPLTRKLRGAAVLNLAPDHLNEHKSLNEYYGAKLKIYNSVVDDGFCILNADDEMLMRYYNLNVSGTVKEKMFFMFSLKQKVKGMFIKDDDVFFSEDGENENLILNLKDMKLIGSHNKENILAGILIAFLAGAKAEKLQEAVNSFEPVKHRLNFVCEKHGTDYINDSKGTNIGACLVACRSMTKQTILLLGGSDKGEDFKTLFRNLPENIKHVVVYGANRNKIAWAANKCKFEDISLAKHLKDAAEIANVLAKSGECVLLSPASASFDEFENFEQRGKIFEELARSF